MNFYCIFHPHLHFLVTEGGQDQDGQFHKVSRFDERLQRLSEIFIPLLSSYQESLLNELRGRWSFSLEAELKMADDLIDNLQLLDEGNDTNLTTTGRTKKRIHLVDL